MQERVRSTSTGWASHKGRPSTPTPTDPLRQLTAADRVERPAPAGALVTGVWVVGDFLVGVPGALVAGLLVSVPRRVATISFSRVQNIYAYIYAYSTVARDSSCIGSSRLRAPMQELLVLGGGSPCEP